MIQIHRALVSVSDKTGLEALGKSLAKAGVHVISTGGTAARLRETGVVVEEVSALTGFAECLDGRVKTLHPKVHAGILADRRNSAHVEQLQQLGIEPVDLVVVNLYPFEEAAERDGLSFDALIEEIDIGGPTLLRAAAKNHANVAVVCDPADYPALEEALARGGVPEDLALAWARKVFARTAAYDAAVAHRLSDTGYEELPARLTPGLLRVATLRYGENPHQRGALYRPSGEPARGFAASIPLQGKELSYNNYLDMDAAYRLVCAFSEPAVAIVKHLNPCGVGFDADPERAFRRALAADPVSAFGGIVALNGPLTRSAAEAMREIFLEVIVAPRVERDALEALASKKNLRILEVPRAAPPLGLEIRSVSGGWLVQDPDGESGDTLREVVTKREPTAEERQAMERAWIVARYAKSNAIVIGAPDGLAGIGSGQTSRVDAVQQAAARAARAQIEPGLRVLASDAFFPFRDGIDEAAKAGVSAVVQPGGSVRDAEVIAAADEHGMAMLFTKRRSFRH